ncbi:hypothetical protein HMPREF1124_1207 [Streptococcus infantis X]|uniref:Extracellular protein n=1 Tax=Streptococcus infantis X TaxID=997830 RepID=F9PBI5_9STRE|nr:hypothetical protein HMPREF1124_1207 [Streptococcus infantis X]
MGDKPISFRDADGNFVSAADVWNEKKLEELFNRLNPNRSLRLARMKKQAEEKNKNKRTRDICITGFLVSNYF